MQGQRRIDKRLLDSTQLLRFTMKRYCGSFLLLFVVIRSTSTQVCSLSNDCGVIGGKTKLFCKVTAPFERRKLNWSVPGRELIAGGTILDPAIIDLEEASDGFYLTILNTTKDDSGTYICEYSFVPHDCIVTQEDFQALMCEQKVDGHKMIIAITYRLQGYLPKISLMKSTGEAITGRFDSVVDNGFLKEIVWRSDDLSVGAYNYTVTGNCGFLAACSGTVDIAAAPTTSPSTDVQAIEGPTTSPSTDAQTTVCQIGSDSGVMGGETKLFCKVTSERPDRGGTKWVGPRSDLILRGLVQSYYIGIIDIEMTIDGFYLIIKNTTKRDLGTYSCGYGPTPLSDCKLGLENFQDTTVAPSELNSSLIVLIVIFVMVVTFVPIVVLVYRFCCKGCIARLSSYSCSQCIETEHGTGVKYCFSPQESVSGQYVTVIAVKKDTASETLVNSTDPDLETVDEIQTKKEKRSKLTEEEKKTEVPRDGEEQHENNNVATLVTFFQQT